MGEGGTGEPAIVPSRPKMELSSGVVGSGAPVPAVVGAAGELVRGRSRVMPCTVCGRGEVLAGPAPPLVLLPPLPVLPGGLGAVTGRASGGGGSGGVGDGCLAPAAAEDDGAGERE